MKTGPYRDVCTLYVHFGIIHNRQDIEKTEVSNSGWMDKKDMCACVQHNGIIIQSWERRAFCHLWQHGPWRHYSKWNKPEKDTHCMISLPCGI